MIDLIGDLFCLIMYDTKPVEAFEFHRSMLNDEVRANSFLSALLQTVQAGDVVLDIGSGTGVLACFACLAGAKHVYACEQGPVISLAREICARNGLQERITFINDWSTNVDLPEAADVLVTETIGNMGFEEGIVRWVVDAKKRSLRENARFIPSKVEMFAVPFESVEAYEMVGAWSGAYYSLDFSPLHTLAANNLLWVDLQPEMFLTDPAALLLVDLGQAQESDFVATASFIVKRRGTLHGFGGWFAAELAAGITLSNVPPSRTPSWSHTFLPLEEPLAVAAGDALDLTLSSSEQTARWQWQVTHKGPATGKPARFLPQQSTQAGELSAFVASEDLARIPARNTKGEIDLFILQHINGRLPVSEIVRKTGARFPGKFNSTESLLARICKLLSLYDRFD